VTVERGFHPAQGLPENLRAFCEVLRRDDGFQLGPGEVADALRALERLGISDAQRVRLGLRLVLCARHEEVETFDRAFDEFFFPVTDGVAQPNQPPTEPPRPKRLSDQEAPDGRDESEQQPEPQESSDQQDEEFEGPAARQTPDEDDPEAQLSEQAMRALFSAQSDVAEAPSVATAGLEAMLAAAVTFMAYLRLGRSRQWRPLPRGTRFDLRRTLRASLTTGGEALSPRWLAHPRHNPRVVLLLDGSRSMEGNNTGTLQFAYALSQRSRRVDVFTFSTELRDVTAGLQQLASTPTAPQRQASPLEARLGFRLPTLGQAWGGGTRIGDCLDTFLREHGHRTLGPNTLVIVASDGLDVGEPELLVRCVRALASRSRGVLWLNPLAALEGYAPTARGMNAALPYLTLLTHASTPHEFARLTKELKFGR
jgi:uncharacterized protein with von Willebrand factor type A (vWA) domain